jgi:hypothetical protein
VCQVAARAEDERTAERETIEHAAPRRPSRPGLMPRDRASVGFLGAGETAVVVGVYADRHDDRQSRESLVEPRLRARR